MQAAQIAVGTTPVELTGVDADYSYGSSIAVQAPSGATLWIGGAADVTTTTGYPVPAGGSVTLDLHGDRVFGVLATGTGTAYVLRLGV